MSNFIDISVLLKKDMPCWPGSIGFGLTQNMSMEAGDIANATSIQCDTHIGTHVDAPKHFISDGFTVEKLSLNTLVGPAFIGHVLDRDFISENDLSSLNRPPEVKRLLLRTRNSELWEQDLKGFRTDYVALTAGAAQWVVDNGIELIGLDYLSIQLFEDGPLTHQILLQAEVLILEGLNLSQVEEGVFDLICLPLKISGAEGAPARAILKRIQKPLDLGPGHRKDF